MQTIDGDTPAPITEAPAPKRRGRPPGPNRRPQRAEQREEQSEAKAWPKRVSRDASNRFHVDPARIPRNMDYQWNAVSVLGDKDIAANVYNAQYNAGWRPVPAKRHPELVGPGADPDGAIVIGGQMLHERPLEYTQEAQNEDRARANGQIRDKLNSLGLAPDGHLGKNGRRNVTAKRDYSIAVPEDTE